MDQTNRGTHFMSLPHDYVLYTSNCPLLLHNFATSTFTMSKTSDKYTEKALDRLDVLKSHLSGVKAPAGRLTKLSRSLQGKKAIVTGAASGMGKETAKLLADEGVQVAVLDLDEVKLKAVVDEINAVHPGRAQAWICDVANRDRIKQVCKEVIEAFGGLDVRCEFPKLSRSSLIQT